MRSSKLGLLLLALLTLPGASSLPLLHAGGSIGSGGSVGCITTYCGPGDIASGAIGFWSAGRAYNAAYAAAQSPLADIVDTTTGLATCTINAGTNGYVNLSAVVCPTGAPAVNVVTFCTVTHVGCSVTKLYDQTGNGNFVSQATLANMPALTFSAQNGLPCPAGTNNAAMTLASSSSFASTNAPYSITTVAERTGSFTTTQRQLSFGNTADPTMNFQTANTWRVLTTGGSSASNLTASDSAFHAAIAIFSASDPLFAIDSSANTSTTASGSGAVSGVAYYFGVTGTQSVLSGFVCEAGIWPSDQNTNYIALLANMRSSSSGWNF